MAEREQLEQAIAALEAQRAELGDAVVDAALASIRQRLAELGSHPADGPLAIQGERRLITVMFADISGFTELSETMDPEALRDLINACFGRLVPVIDGYGGTVEKFIGDEIMAIFGAPQAHEDDAERALRAATEMMAALEEFNAERSASAWEQAPAPALAQGRRIKDGGRFRPLQIHVGINTGLAFAGDLGVRSYRQYGVFGDVVNLAKRLAETADPGQILVGADTYRLAAPRFEFETLEPIRPKGKSNLEPIYRLLATRPPAGALRGVAGMDSPLVGRDGEFRALQGAVALLQSGAGGVVTLLGEAGLGKSRLVAEVRRSVQDAFREGGPQWVEGRCLSYGVSMAYLLWLDLLRGLLGITAEETPDLVRETLQEKIRSCCRERYGEVYPYLARLMALALEAEMDAALQQMDTAQFQAGTFQAIGALLAGITRRQPLVLVCEDLHWADPASIELLQRLLESAERLPLLFICVFRPEPGHGCWGIRQEASRTYGLRHRDIHLQPLSPAESAVLVDNLLRLGELSGGLKARILDLAEGNPFYVEEVIRSLIDCGAIVQDETGGRWKELAPLGEISIPDTLRGVLAARIDRLPQETRWILRLAAVIGRIFPYRILADVVAASVDLDRHLRFLLREGMLREREGTPDLEYIFKHHLTQQAAYNGMLKQDRRRFHRQVAEAWERLFPEHLEEQVGLLAHHWERAEVPDRATEYLLRAGDRSRLAYAHREAVDYYRRALLFLKERRDFEPAARTLMKLGLSYHGMFEFREAHLAYEEGFSLWRQAGEAQRGPGAPVPAAPHALRMAQPNPITLDPTMAEDEFSINIIEQIFSGLVELNPELDIVPLAAKSWEVLEEGRRYVFHLRQDVHWSDHVLVTAGDFLYAWRRLLDPATASPAASLLYDIKGARAFHQGQGADSASLGLWMEDDYTLIVELEEPTSYFPYLLACSAMYPLPRHVVDRYGESWTQGGRIVTNGPYGLESWQPGESIRLVRNPDYHGRFAGNLERIDLSLIEEWPDTLEIYATGDLDVLNLWVLPLPAMVSARQRFVGEYMLSPSLITTFVGFNTSWPPFDDPRVRQAFVLATDREELAGVAMQGFDPPALGGLMPPGLPGHTSDAGLAYDPERARWLLGQAGYAVVGGRSFPAVALSVYHGAETVAGYLQAQWQENLSVEIRCDHLEWESFLDRLDAGESQVFLNAWFADYPDPDNFMRACSARRWARWHSEDYTALVEQARRVTDPQERVELYRRADQMLIAEAVLMPLAYGRQHLLIKPWVKKYPLSAVKTWFWKDVVIEPH